MTYMINTKFIMTLITMIALAFGALEVKTFLKDNFIEHDTPHKKALNLFLNGKLFEKK